MISQRAKSVSPFIVMEVLERAAEMEKNGIHVVHLEVGEPDFDVPECVAGAIEKALAEKKTHYTHSLGDPELREAIAEKYFDEYGVKVSPGQIIVTSGSSPSILLALGALCDTGDEIIHSDPGYACYPNFIRFVGARAVSVPVFEDDGFSYRPEEICRRISANTRGILINSPMNPTGTLLSGSTLEQLARYSTPILSDEIYHGLVYEGRAHSILEFSQNAFVFGGFSKRYAMTGLRLGYVIAPEAYLRAMQKIQQNLFICAGSIEQRAGLEVLKHAGNEAEVMRKTFDTRRNYLIKRLEKLGFEIKVKPTGAFYIFVNARHISRNSYDLAFDILDKAHVGVTPGIDFGLNGEGFLRFSYANSIENIAEGMDRLEKYFGT